MKKHALLLIAGGLMALASCTNDNNSGVSQQQIDSAVDARVRAMEAELAARNDSLINAMAQWKADSMMAAMNGGNVASGGGTTSRPNPPRTNTRPTTPKPSTIGNGKPSMGSGKTNTGNTVGEGKPKMGDEKTNKTTNPNQVGQGKPKMGDQ